MSLRFRSLFTAALMTVALVASQDAQAQSGHKPAATGSGSSHAQQPLFRYPNVDAAWKASQKSGKPVLMFVTSKKCHFCEKMIKETWSHPQIAAAVAQRFEPVAVLKESNPKLVKELGVRAYPTTIVVSPKGELSGHIRGFANPQKFASTLLAPKNRLSAQPASYNQKRDKR